MHIRFDGRTAIVTGAAHGFGRSIALSFASLGARVIACDLLKDELDETARLAKEQGTPLEVRVFDVSDRSAVQTMASDTMKAYGRIDILVNDAGGVMGQVGRPLEVISEADWRAIFAVNLDGAFYCCQAVAPAMKAARYGRIINISSGAGLDISLTGIQAYASAKAGQIGLTRQLAHELGPWGITVNNVAPGFVLSNPSTEKQWQSYGIEGQKRLVESIALKRLGSREDIANGVLFFASEQAGWITGQTLAVDGGRSRADFVGGRATKPTEH
jgi:3-oxoacyl-[acyl-carrier protein] reductase